jgi:rhodanese-related sulfurtransferase
MMIKPASEFIAEAQALINCVDAVAAKALYDESEGAFIIDVRETASAETSQLIASINISRGLIEMKVPGLCPEPDTLILTHCAGGGRASLVAARLQEMGYTNVYAITAKYEDIKAVFG